MIASKKIAFALTACASLLYGSAALANSVFAKQNVNGSTISDIIAQAKDGSGNITDQVVGSYDASSNTISVIFKNGTVKATATGLSAAGTTLCSVSTSTLNVRAFSGVCSGSVTQIQLTAD
jgi:hypothetical protein